MLAYMRPCQHLLSSLGSRRLGVAFGGGLSLPMVLQKEERKRDGRIKEKEKERGREQEKEKGKENDWEEEKKRKGRGEQERK